MDDKLLIEVDANEVGPIEDGLTELVIGLMEGPIKTEAPVDEAVAAKPDVPRAPSDGPEIVARKVWVDVGSAITEG